MNFDVGHWRLRMTAFNNMREGGIGVQLVIREGDAEVSYNTLYQQRGRLGRRLVTHWSGANYLNTSRGR